MLRVLKATLVEKALADGLGMRGASLCKFPALLLGLSACIELAAAAFAKNLFLGERVLINMHLF